MEQNWKRILVTWIVALFSWDVMQKHDIHMCYSKLHGIHTWFTSTQHPSFQPNIHSSTHRLPVSDCISEVRPPTARRLTRSNERPTDVALEPCRELRWIQPLARLQALIPGEMTTTLVLVTPKEKTEIASANPHRTWESRPYNLKKNAFIDSLFAFIIIHLSLKQHWIIILLLPQYTWLHQFLRCQQHIKRPDANLSQWSTTQKSKPFEDFPFFPIFHWVVWGEFAFSNVMMTAEEHSKSGHHHGPGS